MNRTVQCQQLIKALGPLDRCHNSLEMRAAFERLVDFYPRAEIIEHEALKEVNGWRIPPGWNCSHATLTDSKGRLLASKARHPLEVFSYSPAVQGTFTLGELEPHLLSDPNRPEAICFHFRNQYRHWDPVWGFCLPHAIRETFNNDDVFHVDIRSDFDYQAPLTQSHFCHQGKSSETFMFLGHFDHPGQVNDGLSGCVAAYEIIHRLNAQNKNTHYSYCSLASVEIVGSVFYLNDRIIPSENIKEATFLAFSGIDSPLTYQTSFNTNSYIDRIVKHIQSLRANGETKVAEHRELVGNDENVFDSVGYEIPCGTLMRWPFPEYHTNTDDIEHFNPEAFEEVVEFGLQIIDVIESNQLVKPLFSGIPCLSAPEFNLYLSPDTVSGVMNSSASRFTCSSGIKLSAEDQAYIDQNTNLLNPFMNSFIRLADGEHTLLDIAEITNMPFDFVKQYSSLLASKNLVELCFWKPL